MNQKLTTQEFSHNLGGSSQEGGAITGELLIGNFTKKSCSQITRIEMRGSKFYFFFEPAFLENKI
jgi:hypothetical protein